MPELPDLEVYKENLQKLFVSKKLSYISVFDIFRVTAIEEDFNLVCAGKKIQSIERIGKELYFTLSDTVGISIHLMLQGRLDLVSSNDDLDNLANKCAIFHFQDCKSLLISDPGEKCKIRLNPVLRKSPDVFSTAFTSQFLKKKLRARKTMSIKEFLTDQKIIQGIGNAYCDEILYEAKISPESFCDHIPENKMEELYQCIIQVLNNGITEIKKHCPDILHGEYRDFFKVHVKDKETTADGAQILTKIIADRKTYFTKDQMYYGPKYGF